MALRVCVVGAGVAGLRCAAVLLEHGIQIDILEARNRVGGRIAQSDQMGSMKVDIGANWVHSTGDNPIVDLAKQTGTPLHEWSQNTLIVDKLGHVVEGARSNETLNLVWQILEQALEYSKTDSRAIDDSKSLYDFFTQQCSISMQEGKMTQEDADLVCSMSQMWGAYVGERVERQSLKFFYMEDCIEGSDCFIASTYENILTKISARPLKEANLHLNKVVDSVAALDAEQSSRKRVRITTTDGAIDTFDAVVLTTPLGWLKRHKDAISPMSGRISQAVDALSFGNLEKILIEFPFAFWDAEVFNRDHHAISFVHWLSPSYATSTNPEAWRLECVNFNAFPPPYCRSILLFYTFGDCSRHLTSSVKGKDSKARFDLLDQFFEPYYSRLPHYNPKTCAPQRILCTQWSQDKFAGFGSYCNFQVGVKDAEGDVKALRDGMPQHGIYFAGEHTAPLDGLGTVAGAYRSGERVASRIVEAFRATPVALNNQ